MAEKINFTINLDGNIYSGLADIDKELNTMTASATSSLKVFDKLNSVAFKLNNITDFVGKATSAFSGIAKAGMDNEMLLMNMRTLYQGNAEAAQDMYDRIAEYGKQTVYDKSGLVEAQKTMMSFGIEGEKAFTTLKQIGDIAMGDSGKMQSLSLAFSQMSSTGKLTAQDLNQMINAGFNPLQEMSRTTGISIGELREKMEKGAISADMVAQAFASATSEGGLFYEGAEKGGETMAGKVAQINDTIEEFKVKIFEATGGAAAYAAVAGDIVTQMAPMVPVFKGIGSGAMSLVKALGRKLMPIIAATIINLNVAKMSLLQAGGPWMFFKQMGEMACRGVSSAVKSIPIVGWIAIVIGVIIGAAALLREHIDSVTRFMQTSFGKVLSVVFPIINVVVSIAKHWDSIKTAFTDGGIIAGLKRIGFVLLDAMLVPIQNLLELVSKIPGIGNLAAGAAAKIAQVRQNLDKATYVAPKAEKKEKEKEKTENGGGIFQPVVTPTGGTPKTVKKNTESIATGGTRSTTVNITIGDMIKQCVFNGSVNENVDNVGDKFAEALNRALGMAYATAKV
ncbi:MAG: tape measure protein [Paludibacteraceae bacterium]|nr:tape measure protein [Paludibacteraceae bacterium]MBQ7748376.1 tape measure protein [Paludibacteraceae bacterium]MBR0497874.1 tape measure protein [Paludibacteraceae bacterium]